MKKDIAPLRRTLRAVVASLEEGPNIEVSSPAIAAGEEQPDGALWLLRQLRPVSYSFRKGPESKYMRFGFIADELEGSAPNLVRSGKGKSFADQKAVQYQDIIALIAAAMQTQTETLNKLQGQMKQMRVGIDDFKRALKQKRAAELQKKRERDAEKLRSDRRTRALGRPKGDEQEDIPCNQ